jgi:NAD(P)-dependent dehydrogenase (short-subunit alcohol dehydrogenase family)
LITGATRGIGRAIAIELANRGYDVAINDVELPDEGKEAIKSIETFGRKAIFAQADVSKYTEVEQMVNSVQEKLGTIKVLVNNAGINVDKLITNMQPEDWQKVIDVNLTGVFNCTKAVIPHMIDAGGGKIINMSSQGALDGPIGQANEYAQYNILCNALAPGCIHTRMTDSIPPGQLKERIYQIPLGRRGEPEEVAKLVAFLAEEGNYINGQLLLINAGEYL